MKIRINNFFKSKTKVRKKIENKTDEVQKSPVFKVYSSGGQIIKYEAYKANNKVECSKRIRNGASNFVSSEKIVEKYKDEINHQTGNLKEKTKGSGGRKGAYLLFLLMIILCRI